MGRKKKVYPLTPEEQVFAKNLIKKYDEKIRRVIKSKLNPQYAYEFEDVVQNVYEMICKQLDDFKTYDKPEALVVTIAARAVSRLHRDWKETVPLSEDCVAKEEDKGLDEILPTDLSSGDKELLISVYQDRYTERETAENMGMNPSAVRQRMKRLRDRLRKILQKT